MSTKKLQIVTPIVTSVNGETGDVTLNSIQYTPQTLTDAQKAQARENIGAEEMYGGLRKVDLFMQLKKSYNKRQFTAYISAGNITQFSDTEPDNSDVRCAFRNLYLIMSGAGSISYSDTTIRQRVKQYYAAYTANCLTLPFICRGMPYYEGHYLSISLSGNRFSVNEIYEEGNSYTYAYNTETEEFISGTFYSPYLQSFTTQALTKAPALSQIEMSAAPTTDMQIATKKYVDDGIAGKADSSHNHSASNITSGTLPITRGGTNASTAAAARTNLGFSYGTSVPTSAPVTGNGAVFFCQDSGSPLSIANGGTGGATQDAARTNLGLPTQDKRLLTICSGTRLVSGSNITITLDPTEAKKYSSILILLGTPLGGNYGNMYDSFVFPLSPDTWSFRFFKYTLEGQDWQCAKANLSSDWKTFTITAVSGNTNHPCWCYLM